MSQAPPDTAGEANAPQRRGLLIVIGLVALAIVAAGVAAAVFFFVLDDDDEPRATELEVYFRRVAVVINAIDEDSSQPVETPGAALLQFALVLEDTAEELNAIEPPPEAADAHQRLALAENEAGVRMAELFQERDPTSLEEVQEILATDETLRETGVRATEACSELLQLATENDISVVLELC